MHPVTLNALAGMITIIEQSLAQMKGVLAASAQLTSATPEVQTRDQSARSGDESVFLRDEEERALEKMFQDIGLTPVDQGSDK